MFERVLFFTFVIFPVVCIIGYIFEFLLVKNAINNKLGPFKLIIKWLFFMGVIVHELCHTIMSLITGTPVKSIKVRYSDKQQGNNSPHGSMTPAKPRELTFLQSLLCSLAPLLIMTWLFFFCLEITFLSSFNPVIRIFAGIYSLCLILALCPSQQDFRIIMGGFHNDPTHAWYQIFLLIAAFCTVWILVELFQIYLPFEFLYYFLIVGAYVLFKYFFQLCAWIIFKLTPQRLWKPQKIHYRRYTRRRYKPRKPKQIGIKNSQR